MSILYIIRTIHILLNVCDFVNLIRVHENRAINVLVYT